MPNRVIKKPVKVNYITEESNTYHPVYQSLAQAQWLRTISDSSISELYVRVAKIGNPESGLFIEIRTFDGDQYALGFIEQEDASDRFKWIKVKLYHTRPLNRIVGSYYVILFHSTLTTNKNPWLINYSNKILAHNDRYYDSSCAFFYKVIYEDLSFIHSGPSMHNNSEKIKIFPFPPITGPLYLETGRENDYAQDVPEGRLAN